MSQYLNKEQELNYFEIEHLFGHEYLNKMGMLVESNLKGEVYKIKDGSKAKTNFAKSVCKEFDPTHNISYEKNNACFWNSTRSY